MLLRISLAAKRSHRKRSTKAPALAVHPMLKYLQAGSLSGPASPLKLRPRQIRARDGSYLSVQLVGLNPALKLVIPPMSSDLDYGTLDLAVTWQGEFIDYLISIDGRPEPVAGGYVCKLCDPDKRGQFADLQSFWNMELFEPFAAWATETLCPARILLLWRTEEGSSWASLHREVDEKWFDSPELLAVLPLHVSK